MSKTKIILALAVLMLASLACGTSLQTAEPTMVVIVEPTFPPIDDPSLPRDEMAVLRVSLEETVTAIAAGEAIIVDVRSPDAYAFSHIEGAINIPLGEIESDPNNIDLPKDQWIITYCT